jgi:pyruvate kinase
MKSTKIVCTIGPSSHNEDTIAEMIKKGMNIARMNLSHGSHQFHSKTIEMTRNASKKLHEYTGILLDLQGPKIRTGKLEKEPVVLNRGDKITLTTEETHGDWTHLSINYSLLPGEAKIGERIFLDDGNIELNVVDIHEKSIVCSIVNGGVIRSFRGINLPDTKISTPALTEKDIKDLDFGLEMAVDYIALSFVRRPEDIIDLKERINKKRKDTPVVSKIEKPEAINNIDEIIEVSDAIMIARGDLGAETSPQEVPILQKMIIKKCNRAGKPVITATQMLESMVNHPRPTRAEASDVANAIFDETDAVMLSGETAIGEYPVESVKVMADIAKRTENEMNKDRSFIRDKGKFSRGISVADSVCFSVYKITELLKPKLIVSFTMSGKTAVLMSKYRPPVPIIAMSPREEVLRRLSLYWGIRGVSIGMVQSTEELFNTAEELLIDNKLCEEDETVLFIGGVPVLAGKETNMMKVHKVNLQNKNI